MLDERRYDIDALRSIALFILLIYHLGQSFTSLAPYILFVQNKKVTDGIWPFLNVMNTWRIPLVFLIAGIALRLSFQKEQIRNSQGEGKNYWFTLDFLELLYFQLPQLTLLTNITTTGS